MGIHKNSNENFDEHHLYEIIDSEDSIVYKYGICGKSLNSDGTSSRANEQVTVFNRLVGIHGRIKAKEIEKEYIVRFEQENGHRPRGNP